ncbi:MAG: MFS transporter [Planctomycetes bacterium]|nr:MFS transporter [Planctomycetota bacterium]
MRSIGNTTRMNVLARFRLFSCLAWSLAWIPLQYLFFTGAKAFSVSDFFALNGLYYLTMCVFEVPTGVLADRFGRKTTLALGAFGFAAASFAVLQADTTFTAGLGMVALGIAHTLLNGADAAWLYDHLAERGLAAHYLREESRAQWMRILGVSLSDLVGGAAAEWFGLQAAFHVAIVATFVAGVLACSLPETPRPRGLGVRHVLGRSLSAVRGRELRWILAYATALFVLLRIAFHFYQPQMHAVGIERPLHYGATLCVLNLIAAPFARSAQRIQARLGAKRLALLLVQAFAASFLALAWVRNAWCIALFALQQIPFGLMQPVVRGFTNRFAPPEARATILSLQSFCGRALFGLALFVVGAIVDDVGSLRPLYAVLGVVTVVLAIGLARTMPQIEDDPPN